MQNEKMPNERLMGLTLGLTVGLSFAAVGCIGILIYLLRRRDAQIAATAQQQPLHGSASYQLPMQTQQPYWINMSQAPSGRALPMPPAVLNTPDSSINAQQPLMHTYALTALSDPKAPAVRLAQASMTSFDVTLSVVGPTGSYAAFAMDQGDLLNSGIVPTGNVIILPTCETRTIRLLPNQVIYAKGHAVNPNDKVLATATAHEVGGRIYNDLTS